MEKYVLPMYVLCFMLSEWEMIDLCASDFEILLLNEFKILDNIFTSEHIIFRLSSPLFYVLVVIYV
jgi:hypothetical protein